MSQEQYNALEASAINDDELYVTPESSRPDIPVIFTNKDPHTLTGLIPGTLIVSTFNTQD